MTWLWSVSFLVAMTPTSSKASLTEAVNLSPQPSGFVQLDKREQGELAKFIKQCTLAEKNLTSYEKAYKICSEQHDISPAWWQTSWGIGGIAFSALAIGFLAGVTK